jgi:hypothetical protein
MRACMHARVAFLSTVTPPTPPRSTPPPHKPLVALSMSLRAPTHAVRTNGVVQCILPPPPPPTHTHTHIHMPVHTHMPCLPSSCRCAPSDCSCECAPWCCAPSPTRTGPSSGPPPPAHRIVRMHVRIVCVHAGDGQWLEPNGTARAEGVHVL